MNADEGKEVRLRIFVGVNKEAIVVNCIYDINGVDEVDDVYRGVYWMFFRDDTVNDIIREVLEFIGIVITGLLVLIAVPLTLALV